MILYQNAYQASARLYTLAQTMLNSLLQSVGGDHVMRVGDSFQFQTYASTLMNLKSQMDQATQEISSGKKVIAAFRRPVGYAQNLEVLAEQSQNTQYKSNLTSLQTLSGYYQNSLNTVSNVLTSAEQLAEQMASDTQDATTRTSAASEVGSMIDELVTVG